MENNFNNTDSNKNPSFVRDMAVFAIIAIATFYTFAHINSVIGHRNYEREQKAEIAHLEERYDYFQNRFKTPQKVVGSMYNKIILEGNVYIAFEYQMKNASDTEKYDTFKDYADKYIVGREVMVVLPPKENFARIAGNMYSDDGQGGEYMNATVFLDGESLNEKLGFISY